MICFCLAEVAYFNNLIFLNGCRLFYPLNFNQARLFFWVLLTFINFHRSNICGSEGSANGAALRPLRKVRSPR